MKLREHRGLAKEAAMLCLSIKIPLPVILPSCIHLVITGRERLERLITLEASYLRGESSVFKTNSFYSQKYEHSNDPIGSCMRVEMRPA